MKGKQIYFTPKEIQALLDTIEEWEELLPPNGQDAYACRMKNGLGTALGKITEAKKDVIKNRKKSEQVDGERLRCRYD